MNYGIIYAERSKAVRRIVVSDDPNYDYSVHAGPGELHLVSDDKNGTDVFTARAAVEAATGEKSPISLTAVLDKDGLVVDVVLADVLLDTIKNRTLVSVSEDVSLGDTFDSVSKEFIKPEPVEVSVSLLGLSEGKRIK